MHYLLFYEKSADYVERQKPFSEAHLRHVLAGVDRGDLVLGGNLLGGDRAGAALLFSAASPDVVRSFAESDPYVVEGIVTHWYVREWQTVVGPTAVQPIATPH